MIDSEDQDCKEDRGTWGKGPHIPVVFSPSRRTGVEDHQTSPVGTCSGTTRRQRTSSEDDTSEGPDQIGG